MPYADTADGLRWVDERDAQHVNDPLRRAAEQLATDVEAYIYDEQGRQYMRPEFLSWAVARYDATKVGSGNYASTQLEYEHDDAVLTPIPLPKDRVTPGNQADSAIRQPQEAKQAKSIPAVPATGAKGGPTPGDDKTQPPGLHTKPVGPREDGPVQSSTTDGKSHRDLAHEDEEKAKNDKPSKKEDSDTKVAKKEGSK